jgi:hypothetical protein
VLASESSLSSNEINGMLSIALSLRSCNKTESGPGSESESTGAFCANINICIEKKKMVVSVIFMVGV